MAKIKSYAVTVQITNEVTVFINARSPKGAAEALQEDQWNESVRYHEDFPMPRYFDPKNMRVSDVRPI